MWSDVAQWIAEEIGGGSPTEMGFWKWFCLFVPIGVFLQWLTSDDKDKKSDKKNKTKD